jgi:putative ABC transport system permease protein
MSWIRRISNVLRSNRHSRDLDRELEFHLAERIDELVADGMTRRDAVAEARRRFGNYGAQKERTRDADVLAWVDSLVNDVRYAVRALAHSPGFALVAILSLALGIGANTAIFSLVNAVMLRALPVSHPEELVQITLGDGGGTLTNPIWEQIRDRQTTFAGALAYSSFTQFNLVGGGEARLATGSMVSGDYFHLLGIRPAAGRLLSTADDQRGCAPTAVLSYAFWQNAYGGDASVVGKTIALGSHPVVIVGVTESGFTGLDVGRATEIFAPLCADLVLRGSNDALDGRSHWWLSVLARTKPDVTPARARVELNTIAPGIFDATTPQDWRAEQQLRYRRKGLGVAPAQTGLSSIRSEYRVALMTLMVIVGLVLLIACANVANLLLARAAARQREFAIRVALGAARSRVIRQLLTESLLLSTIAALLGLVVARWGSRLLVAFLSPTTRPIFLDVGLDVRVLGFSTAVAVLTGLAFGLTPAWRAARVHPNAALKANARGIVEGRSRLSLGAMLVVAQIAISLTLIVGAGLLLGTFRKLSKVDAGFRADEVLLVSMNRRPTAKGDSQPSPFTEVLQRARSIPGVASASLSSLTPLGHSTWNEEMLVDGFAPKSADDAVAFFNAVSDGYFHTLTTPLLAGRDFTAEDRAESPKVAIVNETMARRFYGTPNPVGRTFSYRAGKGSAGPFQIVGVVKDAKYESLREDILPTAFVPAAQDRASANTMNLELRVAGGSALSVAPDVKALLHDVDPLTSLTLTPFAMQVDNSLTRERLLAVLSAFFGGLALLLATMGLYGVMSYRVARRRNEIGIRMALGAGQRRVAAMVLGEVSAVVCLGLVLGVALALAMTRLLAAFLFGVGATDPATFVGSAALLACVALLAAYLPARRASRVDPMSALRED